MLVRSRSFQNISLVTTVIGVQVFGQNQEIDVGRRPRSAVHRQSNRADDCVVEPIIC